MCNRYQSPSEAEIERHWHIGREQPRRQWDEILFPRGQGLFIRRAVDQAGYARELVVGQWALIPWFAKSPILKYSTNNARAEELSLKATYKQPWARGQRCIIPALSFDEPNWESGKNVWWRFRRADGALWGLAGLWNTWTDRVTGEIHESYTMLMINADAHPLMRQMHKPKPNRPANVQDKRSVIPLGPEGSDQWLTRNPEQARELMKLPAVEIFGAGPVNG